MESANINPETEDAAYHMVMSMFPGGRVLITQPHIERFLSPGEKISDKFISSFRACSDSPLTRVVDQTEAGFRNFVAEARMINPAAKPIFPNLEKYPRPTR